MISKISATSKYMFSKIFKTPQFYVKDIYFPFTIQAVSTETAAGTQKQNVYNFDISTVLVRWKTEMSFFQKSICSSWAPTGSQNITL